MNQGKDTPAKKAVSRFGDEPAYPVESSVGQIKVVHGGFTKREIIAKDMMSGLLANTTLHQTWEEYAIAAVFAADALLDELNKEQNQ